MLKKIKASIKYFIIFFGVILMLPTVLYLILKAPSVQTFMVKRITDHFSEELKSTISIGTIEYKFFNKLSVNDIIIKDKNNDTLLYSKRLIVGIRRMDLRHSSFRLGKVSLIKPVIALITDSTGMMNLTWYLDLLKNPADTLKKGKSHFSVDQINIRDARFALINRTGVRGKTRIDFSNLNLSALNGTIEDLRSLNDTIAFNIYNLAFKESSGFTLKKMNSSVIMARQNIHLNSTFISCDSSILNINRFDMIADSASSFKNFTEKVKLNIQLDKSLINTEELKYFMPFADSVNESVWVSGKIMGTISELRGRNIKLSYRNYTSLDCDFDFSGLPKIENTFLYIGVNNLRTNVKDLEQIDIPGKGYLVLPDAVKKLGNISFNGSFSGFTTDFVTYGEIRTSLGNIRTDISLRPGESKKYTVKGLIKGTDLNIGELTGKSEFLGNMSMQTNIDGYAYAINKFSGNITGKIDSIEINKYIYRNITLNGSFTQKTWDGSINIVDKNIKLDLLGLLNFKNELPEFDFTLNIANAKLYKLNFDKLDTSSTVNMLLTSNFKGNSIDNLDGEIKLLNSNFVKYNNTLELYDFSIKTHKEENKPVLSLRTDFVDADIKGYYNFAGLGSLVKSKLDSLMPSQFHFIDKKNDFKKNMFTFDINFKNTDKINKFFRTGLLLADRSFIKGSVFADSIIEIEGKADLLTLKNNVFRNFSFDASVSGSELSLGLNSASLSLLGQSEFKNLSVGLNTKPDNFTFKVKWDNKDTILNQGSFTASGTVVNNANGNHNAILKIDIDSSHIYSDNYLWKLNSSSILIDSNSIHINKLYASNKERSYQVDGSVSANPADTLKVKFKGIDLEPLNILINRKRNNDPNMIAIDFKGHINGKILLTNVYKNLLLVGNIKVEDLSVLDTKLGNLTINSTLDNVKKVVNIEASDDLNSVNMLDIKGTYDPETKKIDLSANAKKLPIVFLNPLLRSFASEISGSATGKLKLSGAVDDLFLTGAAMVKNASLKINYLQTKYSMNDSIRFDKEGIKFKDVKITDVKGNAATITGAVYHKDFRDYSADIIIKIISNNFQVLNTQPKDNQLFYGTAYGSGSVKINSDQNSLSIDVVATTGKNTKLSIPISKGLSISEYSFITFEDSSNNKKSNQSNANSTTASQSKQLGIDLNMNLEVTPDAEVQIIFDSKLGDVMKGHGSSKNLNITLNKNGDFGISGDYIIEDGEYTFTFGTIFNKPFSVENGGKIMFNGNLKDAQIELMARYLNLKASLYPAIIQDEKYNERIRVEPQLSLSGKLFNPIVGFDIYLPDADEQTRSYLHNYISTEEEMTRQVVALLLMNSFISTGSGTSASSTTTSGTSAMAATTFEMVSSQISNWLSQISKDIDIGLNIRPGSNAISPQEAQLALSTQLLNNKIVLNGNFDVRGTGTTTSTPSPNANTNQLTGDFDAEIKLTQKLQFKVFNRFNDTYSASGLSPYTQGVGIFYHQDFNRFSDLFRKKNKSVMKKEDETKIKKK
jgi:hypothetical protein